jgi:hypothetical protein
MDNNSLCQNQDFLKIVQHTMELLEGNSCKFEENTYLMLVNNLQRLYNIHNGASYIHISNDFNNIIAKQSANASVVFIVIAFISAVFAAPAIAFTSTIFTLASAFISYIHC